MKRLLIHIVLLAFYCAFHAPITSLHAQSNVLGISLKTAFEELGKIPRFDSVVIDAGELSEDWYVEGAVTRCLVSPNSDYRKDVLRILSRIPAQFFYSEYRTEKDKIERCYIETDALGRVWMLHVYVGHGSNDMLATLSVGAPMKVCKDIGDKLKTTTFENVEEVVVEQNAQCPQRLGERMELTSTGINRKYWTIRVTVDTKGIGFAESFDGESLRESVKSTLVAFSKKQISDIFNLGVGFKMVLTLETGESRTIVLERTDLADILNSTDDPAEEKLRNYVERERKLCPVNLGDGMVMTDYRLESDMLVIEITVDADGDFIKGLKANRGILRQNLIDSYILEQDQELMAVMRILITTKKDMGLLYKDKQTGESLLVTLSQRDLQHIIDAKPSFGSFSDSDDPMEELRLEVEITKQSCPEDWEDGMVMTDCRLEQNAMVTQVTLDEDVYSLDLFRDNIDVLKQNIINNFNETEDTDLIAFLNLLIDTNHDYVFEYKGNISGKIVRVVIGKRDMENIVLSKQRK